MSVPCLHCSLFSQYAFVYSITEHYITLHYITLHYITLHYITLHYITLHYITLHYITLHYITNNINTEIMHKSFKMLNRKAWVDKSQIS
jgi:hypothetical protein